MNKGHTFGCEFTFILNSIRCAVRFSVWDERSSHETQKRRTNYQSPRSKPKRRPVVPVFLLLILRVTGFFILALAVGVGFYMIVPLPFELWIVYVAELMGAFLKYL